MKPNTAIIKYVTEEVWRQGHDVAKIDGLSRVSWMLNAWAMALDYVSVVRPAYGLPTYDQVIELGMQVEPRKNAHGLRNCEVYVGGTMGAPFIHVHRMLNDLLERMRGDYFMTPLQFYKEFELIHPFVDGNGRTGKILLNWLNKTLDTPIFPPPDLFGEPIKNP